MTSFSDSFISRPQACTSTYMTGRYVHLVHLEKFQSTFPDWIRVEIVGNSVENQPLYSWHIGQGPIKILLWSQMHGNESTTTKALSDLLTFAITTSEFSNWLQHHFTILCLPMLNPDGAFKYTRANAASIDLNRDALSLSQPESRVLRKVYDGFHPHFAFNMHDQRSLFSAGNVPKPASISFLAPSFNIERDLNPVREKAMRLIATINNSLQQHIPGQVGRYDDSFNLNCVGDMFTHLGTPTILYEAGHVPGDYQREQSRTLVAFALIRALEILITHETTWEHTTAYQEIPQNEQLFFDVLIKNVSHTFLDREQESFKGDLGYRYAEILENGTIQFKPSSFQTGDLSGYFGHHEVDAQGYALESVSLNREELLHLKHLLQRHA